MVKKYCCWSLPQKFLFLFVVVQLLGPVQLCNPPDCSPPGSSILGIFQAKHTGMGCHFLLQGIFPTQGSNLNLLRGRQILYIWASRGAPFLFIFSELQLGFLKSSGVSTEQWKLRTIGYKLRGGLSPTISKLGPGMQPQKSDEKWQERYSGW